MKYLHKDEQKVIQKCIKQNDLDVWFKKAIKIFRYIPVAIVDYDTNEVLFEGRTYSSLDHFKKFFNIIKEDPVIQLHLRAFYILNEPRIVDRLELYESFKEYVEQHEKRLEIPHKDWKISYWSIPYKLMRKQIDVNYPEEDMSLN